MAGSAGAACGVLLAALGCLAAVPAGALKVSRELPPRVLLGTMIVPEDNIPLDVMVAHQARMVSTSPGNVDAVVIDNRPPWTAQTSIHKEALSRMQQSGIAKVHRVDYKLYDDPAYLQRFIVTGNASNSTKMLENAPSRSGISGQHMSSNSMGMFEFLELCRRADDDVGLCIFLDPDIIVYRSSKMGMAELARHFFAGEKGKSIIALNPPTMCSWANHSTDPDPVEQCSTKDYKPWMFGGLFSQRYMILNRGRLLQALPLRVPREYFNMSFEDFFTQGMLLKSYDAAQRMQCGHTFAIHPFSARWADCGSNRDNLDIVRHTLEVASHMLPAHGPQPEATRFDGLRELIRRVEAGQLPAPESRSTANGCEDMCPSRERIAEGAAW